MADSAPTRSHDGALPPQGHFDAAGAIGDIYYWGKGVAVDHVRAMAAYKIGAEGGDALCQWQVGIMYCNGRGGVAVDFQQARQWLEKAAAQDEPNAVNALGFCASRGQGMTPSWRRAREYFQRAIDLGNSLAVKNMQDLTSNIQQVTHCPPGVRSRLRIPHGASLLL